MMNTESFCLREWRKTNGLQDGMLNGSSSYKKQKTLAVHQPVQPSSSALKRASVTGLRANKLESYASTGFNGRDQDNSSDPLIGRKVWTRWPEDNNFYEAVIRDFNPLEGCHALVYDAGTLNETWEWVNLREISPNDISRKQEDVGISHRRGVKKGQPKKDLPPSENNIGNHIEVFHTDTLVKEVDKVFSSSLADPLDIEKARKLLKEHEKALVDAIAKLEGISDGESDREHRYQWSQQQMQPIFQGNILRKHEG